MACKAHKKRLLDKRLLIYSLNRNATDLLHFEAPEIIDGS